MRMQNEGFDYTNVYTNVYANRKINILARLYTIKLR